MPKEVRKAYLEAIRERYLNSKLRADKSKILDEFCNVCGYRRKYAVRILNRYVEPGLRRPGPQPQYGPEIVTHLRQLWISMNKMCSKKMVVAIKQWLPFYPCPESDKQLLLKMSASTIDRALRPYKSTKMKGISATRPASSMVKNRIPIKLLHEQVIEPGWVESDTVAHCGQSLAGTFINSLTLTELYSGWTANEAMWGKDAHKVVTALKEIEKGLPFSITSFASDNGTEFLNSKVYGHFKDRPNPIEIVRRRAYKKNDSAHVEQKNWTHVRELFGYERLENYYLLERMNQIYRSYWNPLWNYFTPVVKLKEKLRIGSKVKKIYDAPKTPAQRLLDSGKLTESQKETITNQLNTLNPFELSENLNKMLKEFFDHVDKLKRRYKVTG